MSPRLVLELDDETVYAGGAVRGTVRVAEGGRSRFLDATLDFLEATFDYSAGGERASARLHHGDLDTGSSFRFELAVPDDAVPSFRSRHGHLDWYVKVRSDEFGVDSTAEQRLDMRPARERPAA